MLHAIKTSYHADIRRFRFYLIIYEDDVTMTDSQHTLPRFADKRYMARYATRDTPAMAPAHSAMREHGAARHAGAPL